MSLVSSVIRKVNIKSSDIKNTSRSANQDCQVTKSWWKGLAGDTYRKEWNDVEVVLKNAERELKTIQSELSSLERTIRQADRERAAKLRAERLKRLELERSKN